MRFPAATPPVPSELAFDVLISQNLGLPATGTTVRGKPTGGSEWQTVVLAEALAALGYKVGVMSPIGWFVMENGVHYVPLGEVLGREDGYHKRRPSVHLSTHVLVSERFGELPPNVNFSRLVFDLHDMPDERLEAVMQLLGEVPESAVVVHSDFNASLHAEWPRMTVIPCMLPDAFYSPRAAPGGFRASLDDGGKLRRERNYVYASAALKGLEPTLKLWREVQKTYHFKKATLTICSPGYDAPAPHLFEGLKNVSMYNGLSPAGMQMLLAASDGIFMVSTFPETFGIVQHQCELAGKPARILQTHGEIDALHTTLAVTENIYTEASPFVHSFEGEQPEPKHHDFSVKTHLGKWLEVLQIEQTKEKATNA